MSEDIALIAGMTEAHVIGRGNDLPWHISEDLINFKKVTAGQTVIMGKNTLESIGKPLPNRNNVVLSAEKVKIEGADVCTSIPEALEKAKSYGKKVFIIGGASVYAQTIDLVDTMYISYIKNDYAGDVFFPEFSEEKWRRVEEKEFKDFLFVTYKRYEK
jgi:dihydrofolate reductase